MQPGNDFTTEQSCAFAFEKDMSVEQIRSCKTAAVALSDFTTWRSETRKARGEHLVIAVSAFVSLIVKTALGLATGNPLVVCHCNLIKLDRHNIIIRAQLDENNNNNKRVINWDWKKKHCLRKHDVVIMKFAKRVL